MAENRMAVQLPLSSVLHLLHRVGQRADRLFGDQVKNRLTLRQFVVLQVVAEASGPSQTDIVKATSIDRSSVSDLVKRLINYGWLLRRRTKGDARTYAVRLTQEGQRMLALGIPAAHATETLLLSSFSAVERKLFFKALTTLAYDDLSS
jgi:MarR family transcriptional regulator, temperature-dependent positive regulator of motility